MPKFPKTTVFISTGVITVSYKKWWRVRDTVLGAVLIFITKLAKHSIFRESIFIYRAKPWQPLMVAFSRRAAWPKILEDPMILTCWSLISRRWCTKIQDTESCGSRCVISWHVSCVSCMCHLRAVLKYSRYLVEWTCFLASALCTPSIDAHLDLREHKINSSLLSWQKTARHSWLKMWRLELLALALWKHVSIGLGPLLQTQNSSWR